MRHAQLILFSLLVLFTAFGCEQWEDLFTDTDFWNFPPGHSDSESETGTDSNSATGLAISNLTIDPNPNNVLSIRVRWTTNVPSTSEVQFGENGYQYRIAHDDEVTEHDVLVIGMHQQTDYDIKAISQNENDRAEMTDSYTTEALPDFLPQGDVLTDDYKSLEGWTLTNVIIGSGWVVPFSDYPAYAMMLDHDGEVVWYQQHGTEPDIGGATSMDYFPERQTVLMGPTNAEPPREVNMAGDVIWEGPPAQGEEGDLSHHVDRLENGNYLLMRWTDWDNNGVNVINVQLEEVTPDNTEVWRWNLYDFITPPPEAEGDWCHGNSATVDIENDAVYVSCRWLGLFKTTYHNPQLVYHLPAVFNASQMGDMDFVPAESQFNDIHDPEIHEDGTILFFDNGGWDPEALWTEEYPEDFRSRIMEFQMDEIGKQATLTYEFPGTFTVDPWFNSEFYLPFWGDADRLENGNYLTTAGRVGPGNYSHIFETTPNGQVVWDFEFPEDVGIYRSQRIPVPPLVEKINP